MVEIKGSFAETWVQQNVAWNSFASYFFITELLSSEPFMDTHSSDHFYTDMHLNLFHRNCRALSSRTKLNQQQLHTDLGIKYQQEHEAGEVLPNHQADNFAKHVAIRTHVT